MGADFLLAQCRIPKKEHWKGDERQPDVDLLDTDVELVKDQFYERASHLPMKLLESWYEDIHPWDEAPDEEEDRRKLFYDMLWELFKQLPLFAHQYRTCTTRRFGGVDYIFTGGLSHGETPTEEFDTIADFAWFDEELLKDPFVVV